MPELSHPRRRAGDRVDAAKLFEGGGELGGRMLAIDWSRTPLGSVEDWPQSLKTCVRIILTSQQPMFVWWGDQLINLYNDAYRSIVGGKHPTALGQPASVVWREIWDQVGPRAARAMQGNEGTYDEALFLLMERHGYQEETYYTFSYSPVPNEQGGTGGILCANTDDTQRIIGERRLAVLRELAARTVDARTWQEACALSAAALASAGKDLPFALVYVTEPDQRSLVLAGAAGIEAGHPAAPERIELDDGSFWPFREVLRAHAPVVVGDLERAGAALPRGFWSRPPRQAVVLPIAPSGKTGRTGVLVAALNPFRLFDDAYRSFVALVASQISGSISNAQAYEEERRRAEALAEIDRAKTAFFSNVSHEFRTPLTLMLGPQEDALSAPSGVLGGEDLRVVYRNTQRLLKLVNSLLDFSRIEAGRAQASYEPADLAALTADLASAFRSAIERGGVKFEVDCPPLPHPVHVDREMWEKIVLNLISNAFKFTFEGTVRVAVRAAGDHAELEVSDTGVGIPEAELPHVFERFHRVEGTRARTHEGSGIGLALVHDLVRLHGGEVRVASQLERGTTFTVSIPNGTDHLPAERLGAKRALTSTGIRAESFVAEALRWLPEAPPPVAPAPVAAAVPEGPPTGGTTARVLVADDNADMRDYVTRLLARHWTVETVSDGAQALAAARARLPDLILTDVMMPNLDGFGLLRALRAAPRTAAIPVIMLSARAGEESRVEGLEAGADDYLVKPFSARELVARVGTHLQLAQLRAAAEVEQRKLNALFEQAPVAIGVFEGAEHRIVLVNEKARAFLGGHHGLLQSGRRLTEAVPEFEGSLAVTMLDEVLRTGESRTVVEHPVPIARADGIVEERFFTTSFQPVRTVAGASTGVMVASYEVTEERRLRQAADDANRAKDEFMAILGHELRNPLAPILTALQLMRLRGSATREHAVIERQVRHLVRLVDDLMDISRITRGRLDLKRERLELRQVVARSLEIADPLLEQRRQKVDVRVPAEGLSVMGDADRLAQVVSNLLTNASKYSEPGTTIHVVAERAGEAVRLRVRDEGVGITPDMLQRVFDMFVQQPQSLERSKGGLGLGLAIVRSLVELHGGQVTAFSEGPGKGSEFVVELPLARALADGETAAAPGASGGDAGPQPAEGHNRVMVVDDNADAAEAMAELLADLGYRVETASDGPSAMEVARRFHPNVCLLDVGLPGMDGYEVAQELRRARCLPDGARIIAITGYGQDSDRRRSTEAGFDGHLVKPVALDTLIRAIVS